MRSRSAACAKSASSRAFVMKPISTSAAGICTPISTTKGACFTPRERGPLAGRELR